MALTSEIIWPGSLWREAGKGAPVSAILHGDIVADVAIVGAGFTGLRAALELAQAGTKVVVLDAGDVGWGASGRTGGQVNPMLPYNSPDQLRAILGPVYFERLTQASLNSADELFALIRTHGIDCQARQKGWLRVNHNDNARRTAEQNIRDWNAFGAGMEVVEGADLTRISGTQAYASGVVAPRGGAVHPLLLVQGVAAKCRALGVDIYGQSAATDLTRDGARWSLQTGQGRVSAETVIVATNAYSGPLVPGLAASVIPITPVQVATPPLDPSVIDSILPEGHTISDSRRVIMFGRREPDNRIVYGSLGKETRGGVITGFDRLIRDAIRVFPQLAEVHWSHRWGGKVAITEDHLPHLHEPQPGLLVGLGYNGRGVAMSHVMGRVLAERALGADPQTLDFPTTAIKGFSLRSVKSIGLGPAKWFMRMLDRLETR